MTSREPTPDEVEQVRRLVATGRLDRASAHEHLRAMVESSSPTVSGIIPGGVATPAPSDERIRRSLESFPTFSAAAPAASDASAPTPVGGSDYLRSFLEPSAASLAGGPLESSSPPSADPAGEGWSAGSFPAPGAHDSLTPTVDARGPGPAGTTHGVLAQGQAFGAFTIVSLLGKGGMGAVYRARDLRLGREVALKLLLSVEDDDAKARFAREARAAAALRHPAIVALLEAGDQAGIPWLAMELVEGESLSAAARRGLDPDAAARAVAQAARGVAHAHASGIVHRDLKPQNVLLERDGRARVTDFGMARVEGEARLSMTGALLGTPGSMAPEQASGEVATPLTDVYGLGATLYEALTGSAPHRGESLPSVLHAVINKPPRSLRDARPDVPADLDAIVRVAMAKEPRERYPSAEALALDLERFLAGAPVEARPPSRLRAWARRAARAPLVTGAVLAAALAVGLAAVFAVQARANAEREAARRVEDERRAEREGLARREAFASALEGELDAKALLERVALERARPADEVTAELAAWRRPAHERERLLLERELIAQQRLGNEQKDADPAAARRRYAAVVDLATRLEPLDPARAARWQFTQGWAGFEAGRPEPARAAFERCAKGDPDGGYGSASSAVLAALGGDRPSALRLARLAASRAPRDVELLVVASGLCEQLDDAQGASALLAQAVALDPRPRWPRIVRRAGALGHVMEAQRFIEGQSPARARAALERALDADPSLAMAERYLISVLLAMNDFDGARRRCETFIATHGEAHDVVAKRGLCSAYAGDPRGALADLRRAIELQPDLWEYRYALADALLKTGEPGMALIEADAGLSVAPDEASLHWVRALALRAGGRTDEAITAAERVLATSGPDTILGNQARQLIAQLRRAPRR